ncbi:RHS repeat-associated core domain-containing protein [Clostridium amylolyticum]|nr:RHS repeat-associated core domain-containing protein [Clostridium amylolyticum]
MNLNGIEYYYIRNAQGDVIGLFDKNGVTVASYTYDSWGKLISIKDQNGVDVTNTVTHVGYKNPYRYRGYRYDTETGVYYLQSRYYNPEWGRFINADGLVGETGDLIGHNLFAYCKNNPVNMEDGNGFKAMPVAYMDDFKIVIVLIASAITFLYVQQQIVNTTIKNTARSVTNNIKNKTKSVISRAKAEVNTKSKTKTKEKTKVQNKEVLEEQGALDKLGKELEFKFRKNGKRITEEEANIIDDWCKEYGVLQHHGTDLGKDNHWDYGNHTHIRGRHIPFE